MSAKVDPNPYRSPLIEAIPPLAASGLPLLMRVMMNTLVDLPLPHKDGDANPNL